MKSIETYSSFYTDRNLGFDIKLIKFCYDSFKPHFVGKNCLELGPANGFMTKYLVNDFELIDLVDGSEALLNQIPNYSNVRKFHTLFENFNPDRNYDTIVMNHVLEHLEDPIGVLERVHFWLSDKGIFILGVPNAKSFHRLAAVEMGLLETEYSLNERDIALGHQRVYDFQLLMQHAESANFKLLNDGGVFLKFLSNRQIQNSFTEEMINAYYAVGKDFKYNCAEIFLVLTK